MVYRTKRADLSPLLDGDVASESCRVRKNDVVADDAIMRDVGVRHDQDVAAHAGEPTAFHGATADGDEFANLVVIANFQTCRFAGVGQILRRHSDRTKWKETVVVANFRRSFDGHLRKQGAPFSQFHLWTDHAVRANV